ncbi:MAG: ABC transporter permease [Enterobacterales bacterium]|nr:ABC transporter permease [Enterobacterales bacterium]
MLKRILAIFMARNLEFFRDRSAMSWNFILPIFMLVGFSFMFGEKDKTIYKVGVLRSESAITSVAENNSAFKQLRFFSWIEYQDPQQAILKVDQHKIDLLLDFKDKKYWINNTSANGYLVEKLLLASHPDFNKSETDGRAVRYLDWVMPGILGMNMMFSCLFGVGYVIVRYRKNGVLKRFQATPLSAFEFLSAQIMSRLVIVLSVTSLLFIGSDYLFGFYILGSRLDLFIIAFLGASSMIALSLLIASRTHSEELAGGLLNFFSWPMMFLSGVWFSLEGATPMVKQLADFFPLTHMLKAARAVMTDGASLSGCSRALVGSTHHHICLFRARQLVV